MTILCLCREQHYCESAHPLFPIGLERCEIPTVRFHPDTYASTERRTHWSAVFDHAAVFQPGYDERCKRAGHPGAFLLRLIGEFAVTGVPVIMHTSFNLRGAAVVNTPTNALVTFLSSGTDALVIGSSLVEK